MNLDGLTPQQPVDPSHRTDKLIDKSTAEDIRLKKACADFEGILLQYMFESMQKDTGGGGVFGDSYQKQMYQSMFIREVCATLAEHRGLGLAESLYRQAKGQMAAQGKEAAAGPSEKDDSKAIKGVSRYTEYQMKTDAAQNDPSRVG
jgi:flagellar protein FlgJ